MSERRLHQQAADFHLDSLPRAWGGVAGRGRLRVTAEDFLVEEVLGFEPEGEGEHLYLFIEKKGLNTQQLAERLQRLCGVRAMDIGYAGLKDRRAVTRQWFSVHLPGGADAVCAQLKAPDLRLLRSRRGVHKLQRGMHQGNAFVIRVRDYAGDYDRAGECLDRIRREGFPNYFGPQRFGHDNGNLHGAADLLGGRRQLERSARGFYLSAARALVFNQVLAARVRAGNWNHVLDGEVLQQAGGGHLFIDFTPGAAASVERCSRGEVNPTGPLCGGGGRFRPRKAALQAEQGVLDLYVDWCRGLAHQGLEADRRALRCLPQRMDWRRTADGWILSFQLASGSFATSLLREWLDARAE